METGAQGKTMCRMGRWGMDSKSADRLFIRISRILVILLVVLVIVTRLYAHSKLWFHLLEILHLYRWQVFPHRQLRQPPVFLRACHAPHILLSLLFRPWHPLFPCSRMSSRPLSPVYLQGRRSGLFRPLHHRLFPSANQRLLRLRHIIRREMEVVIGQTTEPSMSFNHDFCILITGNV